ncbi:MAG: hypothetical protein IJA34_17705 [Lachnospiraceae bacterium]|nr:hypothetical protein [Lachnospiraceae bacterium]
MNSKWGIYPWFKEHGSDLIHPDDIGTFVKEANNCKVFECIEDGEYLTLKYNSNYYRVKDKLFKRVPTPKYIFGEIVRLRKNDEEAIITDIMWHYGKQEHYYLISIRGKKKSKRYLETEFMED